MAKEFDIYFDRHLTECDLLVYSITFHDGISVTNRLILDAVLKGCAVEARSSARSITEMAAHIARMDKRCLEKLRLGMGAGASAAFEKRGRIYPDQSPVVVDTPRFEMLAHLFSEADSGVVLDAAPLETMVASSTGTVSLPVLIGASAGDTLKRGLLRVEPAVVPEARIAQLNQQSSFDAAAMLVIDTSVQNLCRKLITGGETGAEIMALVLGTHIGYSLGTWYSGTVLGAKVVGTSKQSFIAGRPAVVPACDAEDTMTAVLRPDSAGVFLGVAEPHTEMKRYRLLSDVDGLTLDGIDDMTLGELDYIVFDE